MEKSNEILQKKGGNDGIDDPQALTWSEYIKTYLRIVTECHPMTAFTT